MVLSHAGGKYQGTADLLAMSRMGPMKQQQLDQRLTSVSTPLVLSTWETKLRRHPDQDYAQVILRGIEKGFRIGVNQDQVFKSASRNMLSAQQNPSVIEEYIGREVEEGNILGPFSAETSPSVHVNRFGVIPKKGQAGKWRLITDLSYPEGRSVNDAINPALCSLTYITVDQVATRAMSLGRGALIAKTDVKAAYRLVPVHPEDRKWLGMVWKGKVYVDSKLPFGLRSAPKIFNALADGVEWCAHSAGIPHIFHYLDDFAVVGPPDSGACHQYLLTLKRICRELGVPLAPNKEEGPSTKLTLLGIEIDTVKGELRLPAEKLQALRTLLRSWRTKKSCTRRELESLIGYLHHATKVIRPGRSFLRRIIALISGCRQRHHHIRLNKEFKADIAWWLAFAGQWNGTSLLIAQDSSVITLHSDASGSWGCGAWKTTDWFQIQWGSASCHLHIAAKEMVPIIVAAIVWGKGWKGRKVVARSDNSAVVSTLNSRYAKDQVLMQMMRCLFFVEAYYGFDITASHIPGVRNDLADDLSRNRADLFLMKKTDACQIPTCIPVSLLQWVLRPGGEWISPSWMEEFSTFVRRE